MAIKIKKIIIPVLLIFCTICFISGFSGNKKTYAQTERKGVNFASDWNPIEDCVLYTEKTLEAAPYTFEAWVKLPTEVTGRGGAVFSNACFGDPYYNTLTQLKMRTTTKVYSIEIIEGGNPRIIWYDGNIDGSGSFEYIVGDVDLRNGSWTHIAFALNPEESRVYFYLNGVRHSSKTVTGLSFKPDDVMGIGGGHCTKNKDYFHGEISDMRIWSDTRSEAEISDNYEKLTGNRQGLISQWLLNENGKTARTFADTTGYNNAVKIDFYIPYDELALPDADYRFVVIPDTQCMARDNPVSQRNMTRWIVNNKDALNIKFAMHLGDYTNGLGGRVGETGYNEWVSEWVVARNCMKLLTNAGIPYSSSAGNHDYDERSRNRDTTLFNQYFPLSQAKQLSCFGGAFEEDRIDNAYYLLNINGNKYMIMSLEFGPRNAVIDWANEAIEAHNDYQVIVTSHDGVAPGNGEWSHKPQVDAASFYTTINSDCNDGIDMWEKMLKKHSNVLMFINGHWCSEHIVYRTDIGENGNTVHSMLINGQNTDFERGGVGMLGILGFSDGGKTIHVNYYSTEKNAYYGGIRSQFTIYTDGNNPVDDKGGNKGCSGAAVFFDGGLSALIPTAAAVIFAKRKKYKGII